jgi:hypothetical protein
VLADKITDANGTLTVSNNNGQFDAYMTNTITITFTNESITRRSGGGGGGGEFDKTNYSKNTTTQPVEITNLQELLGTVSGAELGNPNLTSSKMKAELKNTFLLTSELDFNGLASWKQLVPDATAKEYLTNLINQLESGESASLGAEHKAEVFVIKTTYANNPAYVNRTRVMIRVTAYQDMSNVRVIELIPKNIARTSSDLIFVGDYPRIVSSDPLIEWSMPSMISGETRTFTYYVKGYVKSDDFRTSVVYEKPKTENPTGGVVNPPQPEPAADGEPQENPAEGLNDSGVKKGTGLILPLIIIVLVAGLIIGGSVVLSKKKNAQAMLASRQAAASSGQRSLVIRPDLVIPYEKVLSAETFIEKRVRQGASDMELHKELINSGWDEHAVDVVMHDVHVVDNNLDKLDGFVQACIDKGLTLPTVKQTLLNVGWREDVIDLVLEDFKG